MWLIGGIVLGASGLIGGGVYAGVKSSQAGNTGLDLVEDIALGVLIGGVIGFDFKYNKEEKYFKSKFAGGLGAGISIDW